MSSVKKLAGETVIYGIGSILPKVLNFLLLAPYLTRILEQEDYGIHGILYAYVALLISVFTLRLETAFFRFATIGDSKEKAYSSGWTTIAIFSFVMCGLIYLNAESIASAITQASDARYVRWFSIILLLDALAALPFARLRLDNRPLRFTLIKVINVLISVAMIVTYLSVFPKMDASWISGFPFYFAEGRALDYVFLANLVASAVVLFLLLPELLQVKLRIDLPLLKKMITYSAPLILVGVAGAINQTFDRVFISELLPEDSAIETSGAYNGAAKIAVVMSLFATAFNYAAEPFFFKSFKDKNSTDLYAYVLKAFVITGCIVFLTITLFLDQAKYLIGDEYWSALDVVPILLMSYLFLGIYYNISIWYKLKDKTYMGAVISTIGAFVSISVNLLLIPRIGYTGAAWSALTCYLIMCTIAYLTGRNNLKIPYDIIGIAIYIVGAIAFYMIGLQIDKMEVSLFLALGLKFLLLAGFAAFAYYRDRSLLRM